MSSRLHDGYDFAEALVTAHAREELALAEGMAVIASVKAPHVHLLPLHYSTAKLWRIVMAS